MGKKEEETQARAEAHKLRTRARVFGIVAVVGVIAAVVFGVLWFQARVPGDAAAKVDDEYVAESDVADFINQARIANSATDDSAFATWLSSNHYNVSSYRVNCINQLALNKLVDKRAAEEGVTVEDSEIDDQVNSYKQSMAFNDNSIWQSTLQQQGMTEDGVRAQIRVNLEEQKLYEAEVQHRDATDDQTLSYVKSNGAGRELKHCLRLVFTGNDGWDKANEAYKTLSKAGKLDAETIQSFADENAKNDSTDLEQGDYKWSDATDMPEAISDELAKLKAGQLSQPFTVDDDNATEIISCDVDYTFPSSSKIDKLKSSDMPKAVREHMAQVTSDALYQTDCQNYLAWLLARAQITYYPVPQTAAYNVDMSQAGTSSSSSSSDSDEGSASSADSSAATGSAASTTDSTATTSEGAN